MWTSKNRTRYDRSKLRYPSDLTDDEWGLVEPLIPPGKTGGGKRTVIMQEVVNGLMYILSTGCQWRAIPKDLPPRSSVYDYFDLWTYDGTLERIHHALYQQCREREQREASPTAAIIDSQSVKSAEKGVTDVDEQKPHPLRPQQVAISERFDRRRMGTGRTADPAGQDWRWQAHGDHAGGGERPDVYSLDRLSVARDPERPAAEKLGLRLLRSVDI